MSLMALTVVSGLTYIFDHLTHHRLISAFNEYCDRISFKKQVN